MGKECRTLVFINEKGGVGKSSCNWAFAVHEAVDRGKKVLLFDCDPQRANLTFFAGVEKKEDTLTLYDIMYRNTNIRDAIISVRENLDIIPATSSVSGVTQTAKITKLKRELEGLKEDYDYIIFDVNPDPTWIHVLVLSSVMYSIITMLPDVASLEANKGIVESITEIQETTNPGLSVLGILFNKNRENTNLSKQAKAVAAGMADALSTSVFETRVRDAVAMGECVATHQGVTEYAPKAAVSEDIKKLSMEIEERLEK